MQTNKKTKRVLKDIDFSADDAHIALCHRSQGVANQSDFVVALKAKQFSEESIQKLQTVRVELSLPDFIKAFWKIEEEDDAKALAYLMGWREDLAQEAMEPEMEFQDWVASNMESFEIVKQLKEAKEQDYPELLSKLDEWQYVTLLEEQEKFEKAFKQIKLQKESASEQGVDAITSTVQHEVNKGKGVNPVVKRKAKKETLMAKEDQDKVQEVEKAEAGFTVVEKQVEMIEKSEFQAVLKQMEDIKKQAEEAKVELQKAKELVIKFEQEKQEQISKQRLADIEAAVKNKEHAAVLHKALKEIQAEEFSEVVKALAAISLQTEQNDLFVEKSAQVEEKGIDTESAVARLIKAKFQSK